MIFSAVTRLAFAGWFLARPDAVPRALGVSPSPTTGRLALGIAARELLLGAGTLVALARSRPTAPWLTAMAVADAVNGTATLAAGAAGRVARKRAVGLAAFDLSGTVWELALARRRRG